MFNPRFPADTLARKAGHWLLPALLLTACAGSEVSERASDPVPVSHWARSDSSNDISLNWLEELDGDSIRGLVSEALRENFSVRQQYLLLESAHQAVVAAGASRWPTFDLSTEASRRGSDSPSVGSQITGTDYSLSAGSRWELDIWGRLSANARAASLDYESQLASYEAARRTLVANTVAQGFDAIAARQLLALFEQRLASQETTFDIVNGSYSRGLSSALDVYLAQSSLEQQREQVARQRQAVLETTAALQLILGRYPDGDMQLPATLPLNRGDIPLGLPSELLTRRKDLEAAWLNLLAADARVAVAHKNRFPRLSLTAATGQASSSLSNLLDSDETSWSLTSGLVQPLFAGGSLRAAEQQARARVRAEEQQYLGLVYRAFAEVENAISGFRSLSERYEALLKAERNAQAALELSLEQYQRGLVSFTTVLESQRRAFDSGTALVGVKNQLIQNRVALYLALGGEFVVNE